MLDPITRTGIFTNVQELYYDLFNEIGLSIGPNGYLYDQDTGNCIQFEEKYIKYSFGPEPIYAGRNEIVFEPNMNYKLIDRLFGYYLDKCQHDEDGDKLGGYIAHFTDETPERKQRVVVKTLGRGEISSEWYWFIYLAFIDCIFRIAGYAVDLSNFDIEPEIDKKTGKRVFRPIEN